MSDKSKESREDMLERILAETAKNPYVPRKQIRPSQRSNTPQSKMAAARDNTVRQGGADGGIPVTRILTEAQKAEAAKARAAKKVEDMKRARMEREALEERKIAEVLEKETPEQPEETQAVPENISSAEQVQPAQEQTDEAAEENIDEEAVTGKPLKKKKAKKVKKAKKTGDDSGIWDADSGMAEAENLEAASGGFGINDVLELVEYAIAAVLIIMMIFTYVIRIAVVDGKSMSPTLAEDDRLVVRSLLYTPRDGDVVVINNKSSHLITADKKVVEGDGLKKVIVKRVIAVGGQTVDIDFESGTVKVDGNILDEKYINESTTRDEYAFKYPLTIPEGYVFVMGDNRNVSMDSRHPQIGLVPEDKIIGEVILRVYPFGRFGGID